MRLIHKPGDAGSFRLGLLSGFQHGLDLVPDGLEVA